jgi:hypothetical protein
VELRNGVAAVLSAVCPNDHRKDDDVCPGRGVEYYDMPVIRSIVKDADKNNDQFTSILMGVIKSAPFQMRTKVVEEAR